MSKPSKPSKPSASTRPSASARPSAPTRPSASRDESGEAGFPGFKWLEGLAELWLGGAKDLADATNGVWDAATDPAGSYTFGRWAHDVAQVSLRSAKTFEKLVKYPIQTAVGNSPPWATIVVGESSQSVSSRWVDLGRTIGPPAVESTGLERLGKGTAEIGLGHVEVTLNRTRDQLKVSLINLQNLDAPPGTYVGFAKQRGASGAPLAVIFVSYRE
jgi:hypothetical protein